MDTVWKRQESQLGKAEINVAHRVRVKAERERIRFRRPNSSSVRNKKRWNDASSVKFHWDDGRKKLTINC